MSIGFRPRLLLAAVLPAVTVILLLVIGFLDRHAADLERALEDRGRAAARQLGTAAEFPLFAGNADALGQLVAAVQKGDAQINAAAVVDRRGELRSAVGEFTGWTPGFAGEEQLVRGSALVVVTPIRRAALPVDDLFADPLPVAPQAGLLGYAVIELSRADLEQRRQQMLASTLAITLGGVMLAALLSMGIATSVTRPIGHISQVVARLERGELGARARPEEAGVLAPLAAGVNEMAARLAVTQEDLRRQVAEATGELRAQKEAAERAARVDSLTGVASRRAFAEAAETEVQRALRYGNPLSLILVDLDFFKAINDGYGHPTGDAVLAAFARTLVQAVREVDVVGRWGGEEFVVLLPGTASAEALQAAERMRFAVAESRLHVQGRLISYSASFGVAEFNPSELSFYAFLARADAALYRAKGNGRNRVELAGHGD